MPTLSSDVHRSATPKTFEDIKGGCRAGDHNGPGDDASGTKGGHKDTTGDACSKGGRYGGPGYGHHGGSNTNLSLPPNPSLNGLTHRQARETLDKFVMADKCLDGQQRLEEEMKARSQSGN
ncbi:hypothetical protein CORC01_07562 [Colletotrichum orchidophilum]|uniref:Uncharacterized protein n=1 Tax=Colletotrichum orchidophilum TaxID=1209926 RepID=A0A1G4B6S9_9PEZI|nr:uncharacterized protein CORC01_07562 [Colletotrichum orchidophilum]OHE97121.1 hypothetical protein CORC01_07562 [Colletotrichum orchidophilum]